MKVAAYQAPLLASGSMQALERIREQVKSCEAQGVSILCCPEAILGGLADDSDYPFGFAVSANGGRLESLLAPLASDTVTTIVGFTELAGDDQLYNAAALFHRGAIAGIYRKLYPAINRSVYRPGSDVPVFRIEKLTFGIVICNDSNYVEPARLMAIKGATALFVPTNNALSPERASMELVSEVRRVDTARAVENGLWVIRADVAGRISGAVSYGSSGIVDPKGAVVEATQQLKEDMIFADLDRQEI